MGFVQQAAKRRNLKVSPSNREPNATTQRLLPFGRSVTKILRQRETRAGHRGRAFFFEVILASEGATTP
jgi:hypothetical protein